MKKFLPAAGLLFLAIGTCVFFRMGPAFLSFTKTFAKEDVTANLAREAQRRVDEQFKGLPPQAKSRTMQQLLDIMMRERKKSINEAILKRQKELKANWQDEWGHTFLLEIDPYHWLRLTENLLKTGRIGDKVVGGVQYDSFMLAPLGMKVETSLHNNLHVYISFYLFKLVRMFDKDISLMHFVFYIPVFISSLALILVFLFCFSIGRSRVNLAGFFAVISLGLSPIFLSRSFAGWFDTDSYIVLFSVLSAWLFYLSLNYAASRPKRIMWAILSGLSIGLFSFTWDGWWYVFDLMIISTLIYIFNLYLIKREAPRETVRLGVPLMSLAIFIFFSFLYVWAFSGATVLKRCVSGPIEIAFAKGYLQNQFWPNTFLTVDELRRESLSGVLNRSGGPIALLCGFLYLIITLMNKKYKDYKYRQFIVFYFTLWIFIMAYVSMEATRFTLLLIIPISISFGLFLGWAIDFLNDLIRYIVNKPRVNIKWSLFVISCLVVMSIFLRTAFSQRKNIPLINRYWWEVLNKIKVQTPKDSIINSWWDYGHWFKAVAQRPVIFDGSTQNTPMAYWMARCFLTDNEKEAMGILRMLNSGSNKAFEELQNLGIDRFRCLSILNEIILLEEDAADKALAKYNFSQKDREVILRYTHHPRSAYFIVEPTLIYKIRAISFLGNWDFIKADIYQNYRQLKKEKFIEYLIKRHKYNEADANRLYEFLIFLNTDDALDWVSSSYRYIDEFSFNSKEGDFVFFNNGFAVNVKSHKAYAVDTRDGKWKTLKSLFYLEEGVIKEKSLGPSDLDFSLLFIQDKDSFRILALDGLLAKCMLTRLYYLPGLALKYFRPFITKELDDGKGRIIVYEINWKGNE